MQVPVLIEPVTDNGYRASTGEPLALSAEGATEEEALSRLRALVAARVTAGAKIVAVDVPAEHPLLRFAGIFKDDPLLEAWEQAMAEYRQAVENDPNAP